MRNLSSNAALFAALALALFGAACGPPVKNTPLDEIPKLKSLDDVMDNQATAADPQFKKIGQDKYTDADFTAFAETGARIQATSLKIKDFSKGPEFDQMAMKLNETAKALEAAGKAKDAKAASTALTDMKATCKACHSKFR